MLFILNNEGDLRASNNTNTIITLIPNTPTPTTVMEYMLISLCDVRYKIVARAITNWLSRIMAGIVDNTHSAFTPGRLVTDNVLIEYECMHCLQKTTNKTRYVALKLDMSKTYDWVEWRYMERLMERMGFPHSWVQPIMCCICSVSYAFRVNNTMFGRV